MPYSERKQNTGLRMSTHIEYSQNTKILIANAFFRLLQTQSVDSISVKRIIDECGVSRQTFYYHYKDLFAIVEFLFSGMIKQSEIECSKADDLVTRIKIILERIDDNRLLINRMMHSKRAGDFQIFASDRIADLLETIWTAQSDYYSGISHEDAQFLSGFLTYVIMGCTAMAVMKDKPLDVDRLAEKIYRLATGQLKLMR